MMQSRPLEQHRRVVRSGAAAIVAACLLLTGPSLPGCRTTERAAEQQQRAEAYVVEAEQLIRDGREDEALSLLALAIERNPELTVAHLQMGSIHRNRGQYLAASESYGKAAQQEPQNFDAQFNYGLMLHMLRRYAEAARVYIRALAIQPDDFHTNLNLALAYIELNEVRQALPFAQRAVAVNPASGDAHANLGAVFSSLRRHEEAVREYEAAAELMPLTPELLLNLAESLGRLRRYEEMANTLQQSIRLDASAVAHERLGFAYFRMRRYSEAMAQFRRSLEIDEVYYPALNGLGVCLLNQYLLSDKADQDAQREAIELLRKSLRINRQQPRIVELVSRYG